MPVQTRKMVRKWLQQGEDILNERLEITGVVFAANLGAVGQQMLLSQAVVANLPFGAAPDAVRAVSDSWPCDEETPGSAPPQNDLVALKEPSPTAGADYEVRVCNAVGANVEDGNETVGDCLAEFGGASMDEGTYAVANAEHSIPQAEMAPPLQSAGLDEDSKGIWDGKPSPSFTLDP